MHAHLFLQQLDLPQNTRSKAVFSTRVNWCTLLITSLQHRWCSRDADEGVLERFEVDDMEVNDSDGCRNEDIDGMDGWFVVSLTIHWSDCPDSEISPLDC